MLGEHVNLGQLLMGIAPSFLKAMVVVVVVVMMDGGSDGGGKFVFSAPGELTNYPSE